MRTASKALLTHDEARYVAHTLKGLAAHEIDDRMIFSTTINDIEHSIVLNGTDLIVSAAGPGIVFVECNNHAWISFVKGLRWEILVNDTLNGRVKIPFAGIDRWMIEH